MSIKPLVPLSRKLMLVQKILVVLRAISLLIILVPTLMGMPLDDQAMTTAPWWVAVLVMIVGAGFLAALAVGVVLQLVWIYRINTNLHAMRAPGIQFSPAWSVGVFFIPLVNLIAPYMVLHEIIDVSHRGKSAPTELIAWFWGLLLAGWVVPLAAAMLFAGKELPLWATFTMEEILPEVLALGMSVVVLRIVTAVTRAYTANYDEQRGCRI
ncbi:MAG TPA: DUF4328 domain-containing protein [Candidatus Krumholzibacteria bacterium]|nr:DUF4328 domain-containing protein [Candidatus Krumholzibacteria bacterium]HRX52285.1 DUF4328 domain-containing protein [Candidatus Krumholzibacteria bacterium]